MWNHLVAKVGCVADLRGKVVEKRRAGNEGVCSLAWEPGVEAGVAWVAMSCPESAQLPSEEPLLQMLLKQNRKHLLKGK